MFLHRLGRLVLTPVLLLAGAFLNAESRFAFGLETPPAGFTSVVPGTAYEAGKGFGFLPAEGTAPVLTRIFASHPPETPAGN